MIPMVVHTSRLVDYWGRNDYFMVNYQIRMALALTMTSLYGLEALIAPWAFRSSLSLKNLWTSFPDGGSMTSDCTTTDCLGLVVLVCWGPKYSICMLMRFMRLLDQDGPIVERAHCLNMLGNRQFFYSHCKREQIQYGESLSTMG